MSKMYIISSILANFGWFLNKRTYRQTWDFTAGGCMVRGVPGPRYDGGHRKLAK